MRVCSVCCRCYDTDVFSCADESHPALSDLDEGSCETIIAGYCLEVLQDSGAKGESYHARHTGSGRSCVVKIHAAHNAEQFVNEAKIASGLFHPAVADIYEAGTLATGELYVVAEDTGGQTVREFLKAGLPELMTSIEIVRRAAEALNAIHLVGLTHGAVSPANLVLITDAVGRLVVKITNIDFGSVVGHSITSDKFTIDTALDSLRYFSPEQCAGEEPGPKSDVYSLGVVLYEMLSGTPPFDASKAVGLIEKHKSERPREIWIGDFELRMLVTHALTESLNKRPDKRQSSANAFARQLRHIEQLATHVSTPPPAGVMPTIALRRAAQADLTPLPFEVVEPSVLLDELPVSVIVAYEAVDVKPEAIKTSRSRLKRWRRKLRHRFASSFEAAPVRREPTRIEWEQPEDDIPSIGDVVEVMASESLAKPIFENVKGRAPALEQKLEEIAAVAEVPKEIPVVQAVQEKAPEMPTRIATAPEGLEEITLVRPSREPFVEDPPPPVRMRVPIARALQRVSSEITFFPTILGNTDTLETTDLDTSNSILSAYYPPRRERSAGPYRSLMIGGGMIGLIALFLFGNNAVWRFASAEHSDDPSANTVAKETLPQIGRTNPSTAPKKKQVKYFEKASSENSDVEAKDTKQSSKSSVAPLRTLPSDDGKIKPMVESAKNVVEEKVIVISNKPAEFTRPRVVKDPRQ
ncbi:MAG: serine/threonine-protein kinase [Acidobacteriota bacterium]